MYEPHPAAEIFPLLSGKEYEAFKADIAERGLLEAIWLYDGKILDGRNRYRACQDVGIEPDFRTYNGPSPAEFVWSLNGERRHLTRSQLHAVAANLAEVLADEAKARQLASLKTGDKFPVKSEPSEREEKGEAIAIAAEKVGVGATQSKKAKRVKKDDPELFKKIESGEVSTEEAYRRVMGDPPKDQPQQSANRAERIEQTRKLAAEGHRATQIAEILGVTVQVVRRYARENNITLPDEAIGNDRKINAHRVIETTVHGLAGYAQGLQLINGSVPDIDVATASEWAESLKKSMAPIQLLRKNLLRIADDN